MMTRTLFPIALGRSMSDGLQSRTGSDGIQQEGVGTGGREMAFQTPWIKRQESSVARLQSSIIAGGVHLEFDSSRDPNGLRTAINITNEMKLIPNIHIPITHRGKPGCE